MNSTNPNTDILKISASYKFRNAITKRKTPVKQC